MDFCDLSLILWEQVFILPLHMLILYCKHKVWPISFIFFCPECGTVVGFFAGERRTDTFEHSCGAIQFEATQ